VPQDHPHPAELAEGADALRLELQACQAEVDMLKLLVHKLKLQLARRNRMVFGSSSERFAAGTSDPQGSLLEAAVLDGIGPKAAAGVVLSHATNTAANSPVIDRSLPEHLPREAQVHRPQATDGHRDTTGQACGCAQCGARLREIGRDVSEQLEYVPGRFKVVRHVRPKLACVRCQRIFQAAAPGRPIVRGLPGPALMAHVMASKYCDHQPLYRQSGIFARSGVQLDRATLAGWVAKGDELIDPLVAAIRRHVLANDKIHGDDTPVKVLAPGTGKTRTGRLWVYVRDDRPAGDDAPRGGLVRLLGRPWRRASTGAPEWLPGSAAGRCIWWLAQAVRHGARAGGGLLGTRQTALVGAVPAFGSGAGQPGRPGVEPHPCALRDRRADQGPGARGAQGAAPGASRTAAGGLARVVRGLAGTGVGQVGHRPGHRLQPGALGGADALHQERAAGD